MAHIESNKQMKDMSGQRMDKNTRTRKGSIYRKSSSSFGVFTGVHESGTDVEQLWMGLQNSFRSSLGTRDDSTVISIDQEMEG